MIFILQKGCLTVHSLIHSRTREHRLGELHGANRLVLSSCCPFWPGHTVSSLLQSPLLLIALYLGFSTHLCFSLTPEGIYSS